MWFRCWNAAGRRIHNVTVVRPTRAASILQFRAFAAATNDVRSKVLEAVQKYVQVRREEITMQMDEEKDAKKSELEKQLSALKTEVTETTKWSDLGFDELDEVEVLLEVEEAFDHIIPDEESDGLKDITQVIEYFKNAEKGE